MRPYNGALLALAGTRPNLPPNIQKPDKHQSDISVRVVSLFSGCGGLDLGLVQAGIRPTEAYDNDPYAVDTYNRNLNPVCEIRQIDGNLELADKPTIIVATPPCQGFSNVGIGSPTDPRNDLLLDACEIVSRSRPKMAVIENVAALTNSKNRPVLERAVHVLREAGFYVQTSVLNCEDYSIPQRRKRAFIVARSGNREFANSGFGRKRRTPAVGKAIGSIPVELDSQDCLLVRANEKDTAILRRIGPGQKLCNVRASNACVHTWEIPEVFGKTNSAEREVLVAIQKLRRRNRVRNFGDADPVSERAINDYLGSIIGDSQFMSGMVLVKIHDPQPTDLAEVEKAISFSEQTVIENLELTPNIIEDDLKASLDSLSTHVDKVCQISRNVILDITSFPKRWFFPLVRDLISRPEVANLVVKYTPGYGYADSLSENPEPLRHLPGFPAVSGRISHDCAFVGVGFPQISSAAMFGDDRPKALKMLFPFPPGPPGLKRNWRFVEGLERAVSREFDEADNIDPIDHIQVSATDVSQAFDAIRGVTQNGIKTSYMLPYGPKPISLAMCLYAVYADIGGLAEVPVLYTQPQRYAVDYTSGPSVDDGNIKSLSYAIKRDGRDLFSVV